MVRKGTYTKKSEKAIYLQKDNKRVKTLRILQAKGKTNKNQLGCFVDYGWEGVNLFMFKKLSMNS